MWRDRLEYGWRSEVGLVRSRNEDAISVLPDLGLVVVADGVGGANSGEVASRVATEVISGRFQRQTPQRGDAEKARLFVEAAVEEANVAIWEQSQRDAACLGMGTTVVVGFAGRGWLAFAHVGDSRLYLLRDGGLTQLSRDHSFIQEVVDQGFFRSLEEARRYGISDNVLTRALGSQTQVSVSSDVVEIHSGDTFLFCTDGLSGMVPDAWLQQILTLGAERDLDSLAGSLVQVACERGGSDNITLALVRSGKEQD
jgi:serine/threonine protein phosphatase PrpC